MTLAECLLLTRQHLAYDLDGYLGDDPTDAQLVTVVNWALRTIGKRAKLLDHSIPITLVAGQASYDLRTLPSDGRSIVKPRTVVVGDNPLRDASGTGFGVWSMAELQRAYPKWRSDGVGTPTKAVTEGTHLILHPAPSASAIAAGSHFVHGTYMPKAMSVATDLAAQLPLPLEAHENVSHLAAVRLAQATATEPEQIARLQAYAAEWMSTVDDLAQENDATAASWGSTYGNERADWIFA